ncbi:MAG: hypothetical protein ACI8QS_001597 [Planctomycetota bacterium]|jgi:hypothetical protein
MRNPLHLTAALALLALAPLSTFAAPSTYVSPLLSFDDEEETEEAEEAKEEEEQDKYVAIIGGDVYTGTGAVLRGATIFGKNGKIVEIGYNLWLPADTELIDARGMSVYPGLVAFSATTRITRGLLSAELDAEEEDEHVHEDVDTHYGLDDVSVDELHLHSPEVDDGVLDTPLIPDFTPLPEADAFFAEDALSRREQERQSAEDGYDPFSEYLVLALAGGVTTADQSGIATKLRRDTFKDTYMNGSSMVRMTWSSRNPASIVTAKEKFASAAEYLRAYRIWEGRADKEEKEPSKSGVDANVVSILKGEVLVRFNADTREDLLGIARLAQRFGFRPVLWGAREGWTVADELGRAGAYAVLNPRSRRAKSENLVRPGGSSIENAAKLHAAGVQIAIITGNSSFDLSGMTGRDLSNLPLEAGFAIRGGLPDDAAFAAITTIPARLMGVEHRVGTLEPGKDFDALICDGDIMHYETFVQVAVVDGSVHYDKSEEIFYAHIRPRLELDPLDAGLLLEGGTNPGEEIEEEPIVIDEEIEEVEVEEVEVEEEPEPEEGDGGK